MTRLFAAILTAFVLWPVDDNNQLLAIGESQVTRDDIFAAGFSVANDIGSFCNRNTQTCETAEELAGETAMVIGEILVASPQQDNILPEPVLSGSTWSDNAQQ